MNNKCIYINIKSNCRCKRNAINNGYCKVHKKKHFVLEELPELVISMIIDKCSNNIKSILSLYNVSKKTRDLTIPHLYKAYQSINISIYHEKCMNEYNLSIYNRLMLQTHKKCNKCNNSNSRIFYPFPIRLCQRCFNLVTITYTDLLPKYSIVHHNKPYHYYKSRQGIIYYLIKDLESYYNCKLEEVHLNDYKLDLSLQLNINHSNLTKYSSTYVHCSYPNINIVEKEYYRQYTTFIINDWLKNKTTNKTIKLLIESVKLVSTKEESNFIIDNLDDTYEKYKEEEFNVLYNNMLNEFQYIINNHAYFKDIHIIDIKELSSLIDPSKLRHLCTSSFLKEQIRIKYHLNKFIDERININIKEFNDNLANRVAQTIIKYPYTSIYECNAGQFINEFNKIFYGIELIPICKEITWDHVKEYINKIHTSHICNICNQSFSTVDLCIKHKFNFHNFQKYKDIILNFYENNKKINKNISNISDNNLRYICKFIDTLKNLKYSCTRLENNNNYISICKDR